MEVNTDRIKRMFKIYLNKHGYKGYMYERFYDFYVKEMEHIIEMNKKYSKLKPFTRFFRGKKYSKENFEYKSNEDLFYKSINNVNNVVSKIMRLEVE